MSQARRRVPPPPQPTPDDPYALQPVQPVKERDLTAEILTISLIAAGIVLLGVGLMLWYRDNRPAQAPPAAVATATQAAASTATQMPTTTGVAERPSTTPLAVQRATPTARPAAPSATATGGYAPGLALPLVARDRGYTATTTFAPNVLLPALPLDQRTQTPTPLPPTATPLPPSPAPTVTLPAAVQIIQFLRLPFLSLDVPEPTPTPLATATPLPTPTTLATSPPVGTPLTTPTPFATGIPYLDDDMQATMAGLADFYVGPSGIYTATDSLVAGIEISLHGRDRTGEWVYACCVDDDDEDSEQDDRAWVRQAFVNIEGNELEDDPEDFDRNDARWLPIVPARADLRPLPTVTPPPDADFPLYRYTPDNRAFLPGLPNLSTAVRPWVNEPVAGGSLTSPIVVADSLVYAASSDNHMYAWDRTTGAQRARRDLGASVSASLATDDGLVYVLDNAGRLYALQDPIDQEPIWRLEFGGFTGSELTGINVYSHTVFVNLEDSILAVNGEEGYVHHELWPLDSPRYPAIGGQLIYVVAESVSAYDVLTMIEYELDDLIWERSGIPPSRVPPVYDAHGVESLAELYIAGADNRIYSLDANTGEENWNDDNEEPITGLAVSDTTLYISGDNYVKARSRRAPEENIDPVIWRASVAGPVLAGPFVGPQDVIVFLQTGNILILDAATGQPRGNYPTYPALPTAAGAISPPYVFAPGQDGKLYGYRQSP